MNNFVMTIVENVINTYFVYRDIVWKTVMLLSFGFIIVGLCLYGKYVRYAINRILNKIFTGVAAIFVGMLFCRLGMKPEIDYPYFNAAIFIIVFSFVVLYGIIKGIFFRNIAPLFHSCRYLQIGCLLELFLLANTDFLEFGEGATGLSVIACTEMVLLLYDNCKIKKKDEIDPESDYPNPTLFPTREKQINKFIKVLEQQKREPYAIMISGRWGSGKNSFVMALEKRLKDESPDDCFIWVRAGSEKKVAEIVSEISGQIMEILKKNNIYLGHEDIVEKYFMAFSELLDNKGLGFWKKIVSNFEYTKADDGKDYVNSMLERLPGTIYIVIDDLDRCSNEYVTKMFKVIRECTQLVNCKTLFLADRTKLMAEEGKDSDKKYFEKYISYVLDLCEVSYEEIAQSFFQDIFKDNFFEGIDPILLPKVSPEQRLPEFKKFICEFPFEALDRLEREKDHLKNVEKPRQDKVNPAYQKRMESLNHIIKEIAANTVIARTVKNYLKCIKRNIEKLNDEIQQCGEELMKENWLQAVVEVQFLKYLCPVAFSKVQTSGSILGYRRLNDNYGLVTVLGFQPSLSHYNETRSIILDDLISKVDVIDYKQIKTQEAKYLEELHNGDTQLDNVDEYLRFSKNSEDLLKILDVCRMDTSADSYVKENIIGQMLNAVAELMSPLRSNYKYFLEFSQELVQYVKDIGLAKKLNQNMLNVGERIVECTIIENMGLFRCILLIAFKTSEVEKCFGEIIDYGVDSLYNILIRLDRDNKYKKDVGDGSKLDRIKNCFLNIEEEVRNIDDKEEKEPFSALFHTAKEAFAVCEYWHHIQNKLEDHQEKTFNRYFVLDGMYTCKGGVFESVDAMKEALSELCNFYTLHRENYHSEFSRLLQETSAGFVKIYENIKGTNQFDGRGEEIGELLNRAADLVYEADKGLSREAQDTINQIRVNVYKFNNFVKENSKPADNLQ